MVWNGTRNNDQFRFSDDDTFDFVKAGAGNDIISDAIDGATWSNDCFNGQSGNDILISTGGDDTLKGGKGHDAFIVNASWYDPATMPGAPETGVEHGVVGFDLDIFGGRGHDVFTLGNSDGYTLEHDGKLTIIHTAFGGTITLHNVEEFLFL
jgi:Ca2+-binding RTX toxin-like protein